MVFDIHDAMMAYILFRIELIPMMLIDFFYRQKNNVITMKYQIILFILLLYNNLIN